MTDGSKEKPDGVSPQDLPTGELDRLVERWLEYIPSRLELHPLGREFTIAHPDLCLLTKLYTRLLHELGEKGYFLHIQDQLHHPPERSFVRSREDPLNPSIPPEASVMVFTVSKSSF